jgi:hypothetical protein
LPSAAEREDKEYRSPYLPLVVFRQQQPLLMEANMLNATLKPTISKPRRKVTALLFATQAAILATGLGLARAHPVSAQNAVNVCVRISNQVSPTAAEIRLAA